VKNLLKPAIFFLMVLFSTKKIQAQCPIANACTPGNASNPQAALFGGGIFQVTIGSFTRTSAGASEGYVDNCAVGTINITLGAPASVSVKTGNTFSENLRIYIDVNNDQIFTAPGELFFSSNNSKIHNGTLSIPTAVTGTKVKLRISSDLITAAAVPGPCTTPEYSQVEDYAVEFQGNVAPPVPLFSASDTVTCNGSVGFTDQSLNNPVTWFWDFGDGQISSQQNPSHTYTASGQYSVKLKVGNANGFDSLTKVNYIKYNDTIPLSAFCEPPTLNQCCGYGISRVAFNTIDNSSSLGSFQDFTCSWRTKVLQGRSYPVSIGTNPNQDQDTRIWIDYNNNRQFEASELVFESLNSRNPTGNILISGDTSTRLNVPLRMRVKSEFSGGTLTACSALDKGQCEDYTVIIRANTQAPVANFIVSSTNFCNPAFTFQSTSLNNIFAYRWHFGDGKDSLTNSPTINYTYQNTGAYTVKLIVFGPFGIDSIVKPNAVTYFGAPPAVCNLTTQAGGPGGGVGIARVIFGTINKTSGAFNEGYQNFTCTNQTTVKKGQTVTLKVSNVGQFTEKVQAWIDWNRNGTFETTERVLNSQGDTVHTAQITIPGTASTTGTLRLRVASNASNAPTFQACGTIQVGQAEDYGVVVLENQVPPVTYFSADQTTSCSGIVQFRDSSENVPSSYLWDFGDGQTSTLASPTHIYSATGTYTVTLITGNAFGTDTLVRSGYINVTQTTGMQPVSCKPANSATCCNYGIGRFVFAGIDRTSGNATEGNKDFSCQNIGNASVGSQQTITIQNSGQNTENVVVWIDWNNDGAFATTERVFSSNNSVNHSGTVAIPGNAPAGVGLRVRVKSDFSAQPITDACSALQLGQYEDYQLILQGNNQPPQALFSASAQISCNNTITFSDTSFNAPTSWKWFFGDGDSSSVRNPVHTYALPGNYDITLIATNASGSDTLRKVAYIQILDNGKIKAAPCTPTTQNTINNQGVGITRVVFGTIDRTSPTAPTENYVDASCQFRTNVTAGQSYPILVSTNTQFNENCRAWIDWNNNGTFEDPAERVLNGLNSNQHQANITVPVSAVVDTLLRMRVISDAGGGPGGNIQPCGNPFFGQCEDYGVKVQANQLPPIAQITGTGVSSCNGFVQFKDGSQNVPTAWLWNFGDGTTSTLQNPGYTYTSPGTYSIKLKVQNAFGVDSVSLPDFVTISSLSGPRAPSCVNVTSAPGINNGTTRVRFGDLDKTSGMALADGANLDYTCTDSATVVISSATQTNPITINTSGGAVRENCRVYIDFNNNGILETNESVLNSSNQTTHTTNLTFTQAQCLGVPVRMRVITDNRFNNIQSACYNPQAGQTEDYRLRLIWAVSTQDLLSSRFIQVYPNPCSGQFRVKSTLPIENWSICNITGKTLLSGPGGVGGSEISLSVQDLPNGIYHLLVQTKEGTIREKVLVQK
jgi:PKD repeat protein